MAIPTSIGRHNVTCYQCRSAWLCDCPTPHWHDARGWATWKRNLCVLCRPHDARNDPDDPQRFEPTNDFAFARRR